ncbi:MAG: spore cortex biosynthesis protein YabQ [Clostridia bacterium]|nr:spore cortex biosynthesis protein YabQ [Clostridia bacterium]
MTIDPIAQLSLYFAAFFGGIGLGILAELGKILRILLGAYLPSPSYKPLYERSLPWLSRGVGWRTAPARRAFAAGVSFLCDFAFPICTAFYLLYILFCFNSGKLRISAFVLLLLGLGTWRVLFSARMAKIFALVAFGLAVLWLYLRTLLLLPPKFLWRMILKFCVAPASRGAKALFLLLSLRRSAAMCRAQLTAAKAGLSPCATEKNVTQKGMKKRCRKKEKRVATPRPLP